MEFSFRNLYVWKKSLELSVSVYQNTHFMKDFGFRDQITRCALSVPSNIAEGYSRQTSKETIQFLFVARGSGAEFETQCLIGIRIGYISEELGKNWLLEIENINKMLFGLIKHKKSL